MKNLKPLALTLLGLAAVGLCLYGAVRLLTPSDTLGATPSSGGLPGIYNSTGTDLVLVDGQGSALATDQNGRIILSTSSNAGFANLTWTNATGTNTTSTALFATSFKATSGTVTTLHVGTLTFGTCTGCGGGVGGTGLQMVNSMVTGQIVFSMNTSSGATLAGFTLVTSTSALYLPTDYTLFATNTYMSMGTSTSWFAMQNATATLANVFNLNVSGTLDYGANALVKCAGVNCKKTLNITVAGCNPPVSGGSGTSTLDYFGNNVYRNAYFQPLAYNACQANDWIPPDSWDGGTLTCKFNYFSTTTDNNGVTWGIQAEGISSGASAAVAFSGATATVTMVSTSTNSLMTTTGTTLTVGGQTAQPDKVLIRLTRSASPGVSTNTAALNEVNCEYGVTNNTD